MPPFRPLGLARKSTILGRNIVCWAENGTVLRSTKVPLTALPAVSKLCSVGAQAERQFDQHRTRGGDEREFRFENTLVRIYFDIFCNAFDFWKCLRAGRSLPRKFSFGWKE